MMYNIYFVVLLISGKGVFDAIKTSVLNEMNMKYIFKDLDSHALDTAVNENHVWIFVKIICESYCKVKLYHLNLSMKVSLDRRFKKIK